MGEASAPQAEPVVQVRVAIRCPSVEEFVDRYWRLVDGDRIFIFSSVPQKQGTAVRFHLVLADGTSLIRGEGRVVRARSDASDPARPPGMDVKFTPVDDASRDLVEFLRATRDEERRKLEEESPQQRARRKTMPLMPPQAEAVTMEKPPEPAKPPPPAPAKPGPEKDWLPAPSTVREPAPALAAGGEPEAEKEKEKEPEGLPPLAPTPTMRGPGPTAPPPPAAAEKPDLPPSPTVRAAPPTPPQTTTKGVPVSALAAAIRHAAARPAPEKTPPPALEKPAPAAAEKPAPAAEKPAPAAEKTAFALEKTLPAVDKTAPAPEKAAAAVEKPAAAPAPERPAAAPAPEKPAAAPAPEKPAAAPAPEKPAAARAADAGAIDERSAPTAKLPPVADKPAIDRMIDDALAEAPIGNVRFAERQVPTQPRIAAVPSDAVPANPFAEVNDEAIEFFVEWSLEQSKGEPTTASASFANVAMKWGAGSDRATLPVAALIEPEPPPPPRPSWRWPIVAAAALVLGLGVGLPVGARIFGHGDPPPAAAPSPPAPAPAPAPPPEAAAPEPVRKPMIPPGGTLDLVTVPPGARVTLDGEPVGDSPVHRRVSVGDHRVSAEKERHTSVSRTFTADADQTVHLELALPRPSTRLKIVSQPPGAEISVNHARVGRAPIEITRPAFEHYKVHAELRGCRPVDRAVYLKPDSGPLSISCSR